MNDPRLTILESKPTIEPYHYQIEAVDRMHGLPSFGLFDEMGTGKTVMACLELDQALVGMLDAKVLIVCPSSVKSVWEEHITWLLPNMPVEVLTAENRGDIRYVRGALIVGWDTVKLVPWLLKHTWDYIIADEAHMAKNRKAQRTKALKHLRAKRKRALTGTPLINRPDELWSILNWLDPRKYSSYWRFFNRYVDFVEHKSGFCPVCYERGTKDNRPPAHKRAYKEILGPKNVHELQEEIRPFTMRRTKQEVLPELPEKYYEYVKVDLGKQQRKAYDQMKKESIAFLERIPEDDEYILEAPTVLAQLTRLRQFADSYCRLDDEYGAIVKMSEPSVKLDAVEDILEGTEGSVVVFSQFAQMIALADGRLHTRTLTGDTSEKSRMEIIDGFQRGDFKVLLATLGTGGVGITLTQASTCVFLDRSWSPAINLQAEDRLHRVGQKNAVEVIVLQARNTVDEYVEERLSMKWSWIRRILDL